MPGFCETAEKGGEIMFMRFSDDLKSEWDRRLLPLWCCFLWICAAPFLSFYRVGPLSSFYLEAASLLGALMLVLVTAYKGSHLLQAGVAVGK